MTPKADIARNYFLRGANCAQAVVAAFHEECKLSETAALKLASGFGGGFARRREVCGVVSGMVLVVNILHGSSDLADKAEKDTHYARVRALLDKFEAANGSIICRELLKLAKGEASEPTSTLRTPEFYRKRPCAELAARAAGILEEYLKSTAVRLENPK